MRILVPRHVETRDFASLHAGGVDIATTGEKTQNSGRLNIRYLGKEHYWYSRNYWIDRDHLESNITWGMSCSQKRILTKLEYRVKLREFEK